MAKACIIDEYGAEGILAARRGGGGGKQERALIMGSRCQHLVKLECALYTVQELACLGDSAISIVLEITFENVNILSIEGACIHDSSVDGRSKAAVIKQLININPNELLMETVGKRNNVALIPEAEDEWELVIPHDLPDVLEHSERVVARFQKHATMSITHKWHRGAGGWESWQDDDDAISDIIPDLEVRSLS